MKERRMVPQEMIDKGRYWMKSWKLVEGCTKVSPGCDNCWSETETVMRAGHPNDAIMSRACAVTDGHDIGYNTGFNGHILCREDNLMLPLRTKKPTVFAVWNDLFHEDVDGEFRCNAFQVMERARKLGHTFLVLTKRAEAMGCFLSSVGVEAPDHIWWGVTVENQAAADERIPHLLRVPGKRFLSVEPMLGPVKLDHMDVERSGVEGMYFINCLTGKNSDMGRPCRDVQTIHAVLCGGESGKNARPMHPDWVRSLRDQCAAAGVPFFFKQDSGARPNKLPFLDGRQHADLPWDK